MRAVMKGFLGKTLLWAAVLGALLLLFHRGVPTEAEALYDENTPVRLKTEEGVRELTMAEYLTGAVAAEMPASFPPEALKAQAAAARSYVLAGPRHEDADVCADPGCCLAWKDEAQLRDLWGTDYDTWAARIGAAVRATDGQYLTWDGAPIRAVFHASSAGRTEDAAAVWAAEPWLVSVSSPETAETVPNLISTAAFTPEELKQRLGLDPEGPPEEWLAGTVPDDAGRVALLRVGGQALSGGFVRSALGLRSTAFDVSYDGTAFRFTVSGYGHGVGMSQYGAKLLAEQGLDWTAILAHYYPGTELVGP